MKCIACIAAILTLAASAQAQDLPPTHKMKIPPKPKPPAVALRGSQSPAPQVTLAPPPPVDAAASTASSANPQSFASATRDADECRATCAHAYYFCPSGGEASSCSDDLIACETGCATPGQGVW